MAIKERTFLTVWLAKTVIVYPRDVFYYVFLGGLGGMQNNIN